MVCVRISNAAIPFSAVPGSVKSYVIVYDTSFHPSTQSALDHIDQFTHNNISAVLDFKNTVTVSNAPLEISMFADSCTITPCQYPREPLSPIVCKHKKQKSKMWGKNTGYKVGNS